MKSLKAKLLTVLILCFAISNIATAFACPMMMQTEKANQMTNKQMSSNCQDMEMSKKISDTNCDTCKCTNCLQISTLSLSNKYKDLKILEVINPINKNYNEFNGLLLSPPPKFS